MALGSHPFPTAVFRLQKLDLISNNRPGLKMMQKSELLPMARTLVIGMLSKLSVVETSVSHEAPPMLMGHIGQKHTL